MSKLNPVRKVCGVFLLWATAAVALPAQTTTAVPPAQTFKTLRSFDHLDGAGPEAPLVQATDGNLYGTTSEGGAYCRPDGCGTVFKFSLSGTLTTLYSFCSEKGCPDGLGPTVGLVQGVDGNFYGTTASNQENGTQGTIFKITPSGELTTLHSFNGADGNGPSALTLGSDGNYYGTTSLGGAGGHICFSKYNLACGTVFKITPDGALTTLYSFCPQSKCADGAEPEGGLVQGTDGNFYGTTLEGGAYCPIQDGLGCGTVFRITPTGTLTTLHDFDENDGRGPFAALIQATDGNFYGTTIKGGANDNGTVFKITPSGNLTTLYSFCAQSGCTDGSYPRAGLTQGTDGNFYGTTQYFGANPEGTIFTITPSGALTTLHSFDNTDGQGPVGTLLQNTNGNFYGTTESGGVGGYGTIFALSVGLGPFVETQPTSRKVGAGVKILGTNLTGATSVTFNGTPAVFTVKRKTLIRATVPAGATSGPVQVVTPKGTLSSNVPFRVQP